MKQYESRSTEYWETANLKELLSWIQGMAKVGWRLHTFTSAPRGYAGTEGDVCCEIIHTAMMEIDTDV